jgi:hypothetical protein
MSQKSSLPQAAKAVSHVLMSDILVPTLVGIVESPRSAQSATFTVTALEHGKSAALQRACWRRSPERSGFRKASAIA